MRKASDVITLITNFTVVSENMSSAERAENQSSSRLGTYKVLLDSGASHSLIVYPISRMGTEDPSENKNNSTRKEIRWATPGGEFRTKREIRLSFKLTEFSTTKVITWNFSSVPKSHDMGYDMIMGRELLTELGLIIDFSTKTVSWEHTTIAMYELANITGFPTLVGSVPRETSRTNKQISRALEILEAKYQPASIDDIVEHAVLSAPQKLLLKAVLVKHVELFDGNVGCHRGPKVHLELVPDAKPVNCKPFAVPHSRKKAFSDEIARLIDLGVLRKNGNSSWSSPSFIIPKKDTGQVRFLSDFRKLNKQLVRKPFPIPRIIDLMQSIEVFTYATVIDLNMGYYPLVLDKVSQEICTIVTALGKYSYTRLPMGISCAPDIFQNFMSNLLSGLEFVKVYLDDILVMSGGSLKDHLRKLTKVLKTLLTAGL